MKQDPPSADNLLGRLGEKPGLREITISLGRSDIYVNLTKNVEVQKGHILYEAILTDDQGSRVIYVDREDIAECLRESSLLAGNEPEGQA